LSECSHCSMVVSAVMGTSTASGSPWSMDLDRGLRMETGWPAIVGRTCGEDGCTLRIDTGFSATGAGDDDCGGYKGEEKGEEEVAEEDAW